MTEGGPGTSTYTISYLIFDQAFQKYNFGVASARSVALGGARVEPDGDGREHDGEHAEHDAITT